VVLPRHAARRLLPAARDESSLVVAPQCRVQRPLLEIEEPVRPVLQLVQDLEPVLLLLREEREQAELDRSLLQLRRPLGGDFRHPVALVTDGCYIGFRSPFATVSSRSPASVLIPPENAVSRHEKTG